MVFWGCFDKFFCKIIIILVKAFFGVPGFFFKYGKKKEIRGGSLFFISIWKALNL